MENSNYIRQKRYAPILVVVSDVPGALKSTTGNNLEFEINIDAWMTSKPMKGLSGLEMTKWSTPSTEMELQILYK